MYGFVKREFVGKLAIAALFCLVVTSCSSQQASIEPSIEFTHLPVAADGSHAVLHDIAGRVTGARPDQKVVLYARSGVWWVQPFEEEPFTDILPDRTWTSKTHPGNAYAALLVDPGYHPNARLNDLPQKGGNVSAVAVADEHTLKSAPLKTLLFSGYEWSLRDTPSDAGGSANLYDPANAWVDENGFLHLRIMRKGESWTSAEVSLTASLGYGTYSFVVRDVSRLEPAAIFAIATWDNRGPPREVNIEIGRWGELESKNAQYVVQPYYVPANVVRFTNPPGTVTHSFRWQPGRVHFKTSAGASSESGVVAEHVFTSGVPLPGYETIRLNHYVFANKKSPLREGSEVIIEKFQYLP